MPRGQVIDRADLMPFHGATDAHSRIAQALSLINDWNGALSGNLSLGDVLALYARLTGARNAVLMRLTPERMLTAAAATTVLDRARAEPGSGSLLRFLQARGADLPDTGSIVQLSDLACDAEFAQAPAGREWLARGDIAEVQVIVLEQARGQIDAIELQFGQPPRADADLPDVLLARALADGWSLRSPGLITRAIRGFGRDRSRRAEDLRGAILGPQNRCGLSRSERRVCQLLAQGDKARQIAEALDISIPTVRTHLRNIYAKTETTGQVDLLAAINAEGDQTG